MQINEYNNVSSVLALAQMQEVRANTPNDMFEDDRLKVSGGDSLTLSNVSVPLLSGMYNMSGRMVGEIAPVSSAEEPFEAGLSGSSIMSRLSGAFRANEDSIRSTMEELGLTEEDLSDEESLTLLANAMNEGAKSLGVPQIDVESTVQDLVSGVSESQGAASGGTSGGAGGAGGGSSDDDEETTTQIVRINGVAYLETTTTKDGVTTTTRRALSGTSGDEA